jgi:hypothetical protein
VTREGDDLMLEPTGQSRLPLHLAAATRYQARVVDAEVTFAFGEDGKGTDLTFRQNGRDLMAKRVETP